MEPGFHQSCAVAVSSTDGSLFQVYLLSADDVEYGRLDLAFKDVEARQTMAGAKVLEVCAQLKLNVSMEYVLIHAPYEVITKYYTWKEMGPVPKDKGLPETMINRFGAFVANVTPNNQGRLLHSVQAVFMIIMATVTALPERVITCDAMRALP